MATLDRLIHDPANGDRSLQNPLDPLLSQLRPCLQARLIVRDACGSTPIAILTPVQGQIQLAINEGLSFGRHRREKDSDLTILDPASGSAILQANTSRFFASLGKAAFVDDQDSRLQAQLLKHIGTQIITYAIGVPDGAGKQALHAIGTSFSCVFSSLPAVFARRFTQDALQVGQRPATRFWASKAGGKTSMQMKKGLDPATDIGRGRPGSGEGGMLILLHDLLLSREVSERSIHLYRVSHLKGKVHEAFFICKGDYGSVSKCDCSG